MSTNNVDLFSYLPGIEVTDDQVMAAELACQQILAAQFPDLDLREGTGIRDLVIRPSATLLAMINQALLFYFEQNTLTNVDDTTDQTFVDAILSNWFLSRKLGVEAVISARLYFSKAKTVNLYTDIFFSPDGTLLYYPAAAVSYASSQLTLDSSSNQYYFDVELIAAAPGTQYNITSGSLLYFSNFDPYFLHAEVNYLVTTSENIESNTEFITRAQTAISSRNLINNPSIASNLTNYFSSLTTILCQGYSDPKMSRDMVSVNSPGVTTPIWVHQGGMVDVYCDVPLSSSITQLTLDANGNCIISGACYDIEKSSVSGGSAPDTLPWNDTAISISAMSQTGTTVTVTTATAHNYQTGWPITIAGTMTPAGYTGSFDITVTGTTTFTYQVGSGVTGLSVGAGPNTCIPQVVAQGITVFTPQNWTSVAPTSLTSASGVATCVINNNGLMVNERIEINGADQSAYNGVFVITNIVDANTFQFAITGSPASPATDVNNPPLTVTYVTRGQDVGYSNNQQVQVGFNDTAYAGLTASFTLYFFQNIDGIQTYLSDPSNRVLCANLLAKGFNMILLDIMITAYNGPAPDAGICNTICETYVNSLQPGQLFIMSDLLSQLYAGGVTSIQTPITIAYTVAKSDNLDWQSGTITDTYNPNDALSIYYVRTVNTASQVIA